ncbi:MAG: hypothetical protein WC346_19100 [Methanogenium sp.]|jgi:hypothetical protein
MNTFLCKAHNANLNADYFGWILSRKLNGFSMLWDGGISTGKPIGQVKWGKERANEDRCTICTGLWTGDGHIIHAPNWWYADFPQYVPLQGECWFDDNKSVSSVCNCSLKNSLADPRWHKLKFIIYNYKPYSLFVGIDKIIPENNFRLFYDNKSYISRLSSLVNICNLYNITKASVINLIDFTCIHEDKFNLCDYLKKVTCGTSSWEGLMLANPDALYACGRSYNLLKLKPEYDIEVEIVGYNPGDKRHIGRMGSLKVKLKWDTQVESFHGGRKEFINKVVNFNVGGGFDDIEREWDFVHKNFSLGKIINIKFNEVGENGSIPSARWSGENE